MITAPVELAVGRQRLGRVLHAVAAAVPAAGLVLSLVLLFASGADVNSADTTVIPVGVRLLRFFSYFTVQSNILVLIASVVLMLRPTRDGTIWRVVRLDSLLAILITGIVFATILAPLVHPEGADFIANALLHYICPWLTLVVWLVVGPRPRVSWVTIPAAFIWPAAWIAYTLIHGAISGWYPYPFLDVTQLGYPRTALNVLLILVGAAVIGVIFRFLDRLPPLVHSR
ncbi:hypothetical protein GCM10011575_18470 [Microlunatus endophyticus]|uniref:FAR-17a/AIG1-like protein n=1 Tax=Microlunatus endophyticus TaxID=1716077 RepID=A0A917S7S2_9ACTN|nr:Pr6Pr family membrane protein [Microlunatus endophyticus]GGL60264.1 hypothetical protein GCM10011575_18470 [Microlunatus endophyticus]